MIFTGRLEGDELYSWYNVATSFILASYKEAFGAVTNEALLAGCWAVISNKAGSQCLINPGVNGDIFNPMDVEELHQKMQYVCENLTPVSKSIALRENGMQVRYKQMIEQLIKAIENEA